jgi:hypothetical protein
MVPPLHRYYESTPTSCRPSRRTSLPSFGATAATPWRSLPQAQGAPPAGLGFVDRTPRYRFTRRRRQDLPGSWQDPSMNVPCSSTPAESPRSATAALRCCLPLSRQCRLPRFLCFRGSITRPMHSLSTLRRNELPHCHARLASGGWPALPGGTAYPLGPKRKVSGQPSSFPRLRLAHRE